MPCINDKIEQNKATIENEKAHQNALSESINPARVSRFRFDPENVMALLRQRIVGQPDVLSAMDDMLHTVKADIGADNRPLSVSLFLGPTGVGKTETVRIITEAIYGTPEKMCRIDMNTLAQEHYAAALTGAPPGYVGSKEGQTLLNQEAIQGSFSKPGIVLFDELEKASKEVIRSLLNVLDSGQLALSSGAKTIDFRNSLIFMTSNLGAQEVADYQASYQQGWRKWLGRQPDNENAVLDKALHRGLDPEFINRVDRILAFQRLNQDWLDGLLDIELQKLNQQLEKKGARVSLATPLRQHLCEQHDNRFGARDLARRLRSVLQPPLAKAMLSHHSCDSFVADLQQQTVTVIPVD